VGLLLLGGYVLVGRNIVRIIVGVSPALVELRPDGFAIPEGINYRNRESQNLAGQILGESFADFLENVFYVLTNEESCLKGLSL
jgi:hypothetical protein